MGEKNSYKHWCRLDWFALVALAFLIGWGACYASFGVRHLLAQDRVLVAANQNWSDIYDGMARKVGSARAVAAPSCGAPVAPAAPLPLRHAAPVDYSRDATLWLNRGVFAAIHPH